MLLLLTLTFALCNVLPFLLNLAECIKWDLFSDEHTSSIAFLLNDLANFLVVLNRYKHSLLARFFSIFCKHCSSVPPLGFTTPYFRLNTGRGFQACWGKFCLSSKNDWRKFHSWQISRLKKISQARSGLNVEEQCNSATSTHNNNNMAMALALP